MWQLPVNLVEEEILCRVPATSLKRLRSTCKLWNGLFNDRRFINNHFDKAAKEFLVLMLTKEYRICSMSVDLNGIPSAEFKGELSLLDHLSSHLAQFYISQVVHYDGKLLCTNKRYTRLVVWNPCTGQTKWIAQPIDRLWAVEFYTLGSYQDNNSSNKSYKILRHRGHDENQILEIYEIKSSLWRILDVTLDFHLYNGSSVCLKGKTYWFASDKKWEIKPIKFLVSFDYTTEKFARLCLPYPYFNYENVALSVIRDEKLSVLLRIRRINTTNMEIWIRDEIDETKVVSWSKILVVAEIQPGICLSSSFLVDEEKKVVLCSDRWMEEEDVRKSYDLVSIVEEDKEVKQVYCGASTMRSCWPLLFNYAPSLVQIQ
ncbi:PREDICTED: probable F-box protein At5g47300 [Camelina sativa]|uniref:Probable F-box protein At5g47300 n=1 Tax=Camelina sativa TaxID=90675 RepID=A0ABM0T7S7_CAMSA|nr:PREDICTED: probable F-box protein At5g47300 [Camelina sativa]